MEQSWTRTKACACDSYRHICLSSYLHLNFSFISKCSRRSYWLVHLVVCDQNQLSEINFRNNTYRENVMTDFRTCNTTNSIKWYRRDERLTCRLVLFSNTCFNSALICSVWNNKSIKLWDCGGGWQAKVVVKAI